MKQYQIIDMMDEVGKIHNEMRDQLNLSIDSFSYYVDVILS